MTDTPRTVILQAPITVKIGPVPDNITSHSQIFTFGLAHLQRIIKERGLPIEIDGKNVIASYLDGDVVASFTATGAKLDDRHFRIQPDGNEHSLEISDDRGVNFTRVATFSDAAFANAVGEAWVAGHAEKAQA